MDTEHLPDPRTLSDIRIESIMIVDEQHALPGCKIEVVQTPVRTLPFDREFAEHSETVCKAIIEAFGLSPETIGLAVSGNVNTLLTVDMTSPRRIHRRWHIRRSARRAWEMAIVAQRARHRHRRHARAVARRRQRGQA